MTKTITIKSSLFFASMDGARSGYENVEAIHAPKQTTGRL